MAKGLRHTSEAALWLTAGQACADCHALVLSWAAEPAVGVKGAMFSILAG